MKRVVQEKIYVILNLALHKQYVGRTRNLDSRYSDHVSKLRAGRDENPDLQRDWGRDGEENFIWVDVLLRAGALPPNILEDLLIDTLGTVDPALGYNGMTSRGWSSHARLRDMERKVIRARKFQLRPGGSLDDPIMESYLETVWKGHGKENREQPKREESEEQRDALEEHEDRGDGGAREQLHPEEPERSQLLRQFARRNRRRLEPLRQRRPQPLVREPPRGRPDVDLLLGQQGVDVDEISSQSGAPAGLA